MLNAALPAHTTELNRKTDGKELSSILVLSEGQWCQVRDRGVPPIHSIKSDKHKAESLSQHTFVPSFQMSNNLTLYSGISSPLKYLHKKKTT